MKNYHCKDQEVARRIVISLNEQLDRSDIFRGCTLSGYRYIPWNSLREHLSCEFHIGRNIGQSDFYGNTRFIVGRKKIKEKKR